MAARSAGAKERGRGHSRQLDRGRIVGAALDLARSGTGGAFSMRQLAASLDVDPAALYWHFRNKRELMAEVAQAASDAIPIEVPETGTWQERTMAVCSAIRDGLRSHPELGIQAAASPSFSPFNARSNGILVALLEESGLSGPSLLFAAQGLLHEVAAIAHSEVLSGTQPSDGVRAFTRSLGEHLPESSSGAWRDLARMPIAESFDAYFEFAIGAFLDGIALRARGG